MAIGFSLIASVVTRPSGPAAASCRRAPDRGSTRPANAPSRAVTRFSSAVNSACWVISTVTRSTVPSRSRVSAMSKARREASTTCCCSRSRSAPSCDRDQRLLDVGEARDHRLAIEAEQLRAAGPAPAPAGPPAGSRRRSAASGRRPASRTPTPDGTSARSAVLVKPPLPVSEMLGKNAARAASTLASAAASCASAERMSGRW